MAFAPVQAVVSGSTTGNSLNTTIAATTQGNLVVVYIPILFETDETCTGVSDDKGNTYVLSARIASGGGANDKAVMYYAYGMQTTGGTTVITTTYSGTTRSKRPIVQEFSGFNPGSANADVFDVATSGNNTSVNSAAVSTLTPTATGELIVSGAIITNTITETLDAGYTLYGDGGYQIGMYKLSGGATETAPFTWSGSALNFAQYAIAFKVGVPIVSTANNSYFHFM